MIEDERKQLKSLFEFANKAIILTDSQGKIIRSNPEAQRLFEYTATEMLHHPITWLMPDDNDPDNTKEQQRVSKDRLNQNGNGKETGTGIKKNGARFSVELSMSSYQQQNKLHVVTFVTDITQQEESEKWLLQKKLEVEKVAADTRRMNQELENKVTARTLILQEALQELEKSQSEIHHALNKEKELNEIKSRFVSMASHEFRTPLSTILSSASLVTKYRHTADQDKRDKHINKIKSAVQHLNELLEDFLQLGKLEEEKVNRNIDSFNVTEFVEDVLDELKHALKPGQQLQLNFKGPEMFITDKRLLKNVLINLVNNAIKFSHEHKPVEISVINSISQLTLHIKDYGIGIPMEDLPYLFSTFYRCNNAGNIQGTGLGLHIVKRYIEILQGEITLSSQLNEGTTFNVCLPSQQIPENIEA